MVDYSKYSCCNMLQYMENRSRQLGRDNHIDYILSMENAESIEELMKIYNNIYKFLAILFFGTKKVPKNWYKPEVWGYNRTYLIEELNTYLNECILKWYQRQDSPTELQAILCIANLRYSDNTYWVAKEILDNPNPKAEKEISRLIGKRNTQYIFRKKLEKYYDYGVKYEREYLKLTRYLAAHGRIMDVAEIYFGKEYGIKYGNLIEDYQKDLEEEKRQEEDRVKREKEFKKQQDISSALKVFDTIGGGLFSFLLSLPFGFFGGIFSSIKKGKL